MCMRLSVVYVLCATFSRDSCTHCYNIWKKYTSLSASKVLESVLDFELDLTRFFVLILYESFSIFARFAATSTH